jgi:Flp pilus assembly protein CpaB
LKRSNRIVLLFGILLAVASFGGVILLFNQRQAPVSSAPTELPTVYAKQDIPLGTVVTQDMIEARNQQVSVRPTDAFGDIGQVVGKTARTGIKQGALLTPADFAAGAGGGNQDVAQLLPPGLRAIAVAVDQNTGVGTLINVGDRVDLVIGFTGADKVPILTVDPTTRALTPVTGINSTTTKLIVQDMQVIGTLVSQPQTTTGGASPAPGGLNGQTELVILAVTAQQAEVIKFAQIDGLITLVLRSPKDFVDASGAPVTPPIDQTSGIVLKTLIDRFGVLPPEVIFAPNSALPSAAPLPSATPTPTPTPAPTPSPSPSPSP